MAPKFTPQTITVPVEIGKYGTSGQVSLYIKDKTNGEKEFTDYLSTYEIIKRKNRITSVTFSLIGLETDDKDNYVERGNVFLFFYGTKLIVKGLIDTVTNNSVYATDVTGSGIEYLLARFKTNGDYTTSGEQTSTIISTEISGISDVLTGETITVGTVENYGKVFVRFENEDKLTGLTGLAESVGYDWIVNSVYPYGTTDNTFEFYETLGTEDSVLTFDSEEMVNSSKTTDMESMINSITMLGYGDGINQLKTNIYAATNTITTLDADITSSATTATVTDASLFDDAGTVWIGMEQCVYTKALNTLTLTRATADGTDSNSQDYLKAYAHTKGTPVWDTQYLTTSPEAGTSIATYGVHEETYTNKAIIKQDFLDRTAYVNLINQKNPIDRIVLQTTDLDSTFPFINLGDLVTCTDTVSGLGTSQEFEICGMIFKFSGGGDTLDIELSNVGTAFVDKVAGVSNNVEKASQYAQGATNIYTISEKENCDNSNPLNMRFYIPEEAVAINKVLLKFTTQPYRAYTSVSQTASSGGSSTPTSNDGGGSTPTTNGDTHHHHISNNLTVGGEFSPSSPSASIGFASNHKICDGAGTSVIDVGLIAYGNSVSTESDSHDHDVTIADHNHTVTIAAHTHDVTIGFAITEDTFPTTPTVTVTAGIEGSETPVTGSLFDINGKISVSDGGTYEADISSTIRAVGTGNWVNIKFVPSGATVNKRMRIEANAIIQVYINSED